MLNFEFYNPTRIVFGQGRYNDLDRLIPPHARVLVLFGGESARKNGTLDMVYQGLGKRHVESFGGIEPNPTYETLMKAVEQVRANRLDYLLAVGGGSVIDGTKFVAAAVFASGDPWEILLSHGANVKQALPFGTVLTLPATGSEMNSGSVITRSDIKAKLFFTNACVFPQFSLLDPTRSYSLPPRQLANGIVDAYTHVMEQYLTYPVNALVQDRFAEGLLSTLIEIGPRVLANPQDYDLQANFMWTATLALNGLIGAGVPQDWATHMIGHELTALYGLDHAQTLAIVLPAMLNERKADKRVKLMQYAERVWGLKEGSEEARIDAAITRTREFFESLGVQTRLSGYGIDAEAIPPVLKQLESHGMVHLGEHRSVDLDVSRKVLEACL
ncbi:NADP-dependent alcohol dehydrogenase [Novimethylophilus kurashikiensis]|uniref:NADP-dependent alcohol dehydrogenase n=1 Tax=Novimethylophilus kurashikiensis TaxID=1825523 RepID=A0A2R5FF42_9PROT|nr:iron-containing alcohol dehydrogenase [Novimethylophilus kurashikiensis]GBG15004.1 NADP-dependent alcohol dehydrogenase [Novimethylophilus kurashikiensis]